MKPTSHPVSFRAYDYATGVQFYLLAEYEHTKLMDLVTYNTACMLDIGYLGTRVCAQMYTQFVFAPSTSEHE